MIRAVISEGPTHRFCTFNNIFSKFGSMIPTLGTDWVFVPIRTHTSRKHSLPVSAVFNKQSVFLQILFPPSNVQPDRLAGDSEKSCLDTCRSCECVRMNNNCSTSETLRARLYSLVCYCIISAIILTFPLTSNTSVFARYKTLSPHSSRRVYHFVSSLCLLICRGQMI